VAADQVLFFMQSGGEAALPLEDWLFSLAPEAGPNGTLKAQLLRKDLQGRELGRRDWILISKEGRLFWTDSAGRELPVLDASPAPPLAQPAERISCRVSLFEDEFPMPGLCAAAIGGVLKVAPGPLQFIVRKDPAAQGSSLVRGLVTLFTGGLLIPGANNRDETAYLSAYHSPGQEAVSPSLRRDLELFWSKSGVRRGSELLRKNRGAGIEFVTAAFSRLHDDELLHELAVKQLAVLSDPSERWVLLRFVLGRLRGFEAQLAFTQAARRSLDFKNPALAALRASVFTGGDESGRQFVEALLYGRMPVLSKRLSDGVFSFQDAREWRKLMPVLRSTTVLAPVEAVFFLQYLPERLKPEAVELFFSRASEASVPDLVKALLSSLVFDEDRLISLAEVLRWRPSREHAQILKVFYTALQFDEGRIALLKKYRIIWPTLSLREREEFARAVVFERKKARELLGD